MKLAVDIRQASQNNRIFLFEGPPGSGKSTFLNILLQKLEEYTFCRKEVFTKPIGGLILNAWWFQAI